MTGSPATRVPLRRRTPRRRPGHTRPRPQVLRCGDGRLVVPAEGKGGYTLSIDAIGTARNVILSAAKPTQADMVRKCLGWSGADKNTAWPAGMIAARPGKTEVEWLLTEDSAVELPAL